MIEYNNLIQLPKIEQIYTYRKKRTSDEILTFDLEATSLFDIEGEFLPYDYKLPKSYYIGREKKALPYIWQFGYNDKVYYSSNFHLFGDLLKQIATPDVEQFIFVHNLAYDAHFIFGVIKKRGWHLSNVIARGIRKVIQFHIDELNITFRCSYALSGLSLAVWGEQMKCEHIKLCGELDYRKARSPLSVKYMTPQELAYCENDILVLYEALKTYRDRYKHLSRIPLTQTGEVRKEMNANVSYWYHKDVWSRIPPPEIYMRLMSCFMGGVVHANYTHTGKVRRVASYDFASSYPTRMVTEKFPIGVWFRISKREIDNMKKGCCILYHVRLHNFKSKFLNHFLPSSKCIDKVGCRYDNGRLISGKRCECHLTDVDMEIVKRSYDIKEVEILDLYACHKKYLPKEVIEFILEYFGRKTKLKGLTNEDIPNAEEMYMHSKACINALYGISVYSPLKQNYAFDLYGEDNVDGKLWEVPPFNLNFIESKLESMKSSYSILFDYAVGCWVTAYARRALWQLVTGYYGEVDADADEDSFYYDTDSNKFVHPEKHTALIDYINAENRKKIEDVCNYYGFDSSLFSPLDKKGKPHTIGELEYENTFNAKSLGAKKYMIQFDDGHFEITIAGVPKSGVVTMKNGFDDFKKGYEFPYEWEYETPEGEKRTAGKINMIYDEHQTPFTFTDSEGHEYTCNDIEYAIIAQPTTYTLGVTDEYEKLVMYSESNIYF